MFASVMDTQIVNVALPELQGASHWLAEEVPDRIIPPLLEHLGSHAGEANHGLCGPRRPHIGQFGAQLPVGQLPVVAAAGTGVHGVGILLPR
jgi:hypothetical protein